MGVWSRRAAPGLNELPRQRWPVREADSSAVAGSRGRRRRRRSETNLKIRQGVSQTAKCQTLTKIHELRGTAAHGISPCVTGPG